MTVVIETRRLSLRRQTAGDAPFILRLLNDADFLRHIGDAAFARSTTPRLTQTAPSRPDTHESGDT
jgi:hypothetical protein